MVATTGTLVTARERHGRGDIGLLERPAEALQLEVVAAREELEPRAEQPLGIRLAGIDERAADVALAGRGQRDQAAAVLAP